MNRGMVVLLVYKGYAKANTLTCGVIELFQSLYFSQHLKLLEHSVEYADNYNAHMCEQQSQNRASRDAFDFFYANTKECIQNRKYV